MADDGTKQSTTWPLPKFYFSVWLGDDQARFQEVSGLEADTGRIEFRHGDNPSFFPIKMPGLGKVGNVTLRKGIFAKDAKFWNWFSEIKMNTITRRTVVIHLLDDNGEPKMTWTLSMPGRPRSPAPISNPTAMRSRWNPLSLLATRWK